MNRKRKNIIQKNKISKIYSFQLGGYWQKVLIEGKRNNLPIVIVLHGGPGTPIPFSVGCRGMFPNLTDRFIMVYWDQLGCGINNYKITDDFTIENFVNMAKDLILNVKRIFPKNKLFIFSTSWGTVLSALVVGKCESVIDGVVASGQIVSNLFFNDEVIDTLKNTRISRKRLDIIKNTNSENATKKEINLVSLFLMKYSDSYNNKKDRKLRMGKVIKGLLTSPDYKLKDFKATFINGYRNNKSIWNELLKIDLTKDIKNVKIPYIIIQGDTDVVASTKKIKDLVETSNNNKLKCYIVKNTGHIPGKEMMKTILDKIIDITAKKLSE